MTNNAKPYQKYLRFDDVLSNPMPATLLTLSRMGVSVWQAWRTDYPDVNIYPILNISERDKLTSKTLETLAAMGSGIWQEWQQDYGYACLNDHKTDRFYKILLGNQNAKDLTESELIRLSRCLPLWQEWRQEYPKQLGYELILNNKHATLQDSTRAPLSQKLLMSGAGIFNEWQKALRNKQVMVLFADDKKESNQQLQDIDKHTTLSKHASQYLDISVSESLNASGFTFHTSVHFLGVEFAELADFTGAEFRELADFTDTKFMKLANFRGAKFSEGANFREVTFNGRAEFAGVEFKWAEFEGAEFNMWADFTSVEFEKDAIFSHATFSGKTLFSYVLFNNAPEFYGAKLHQDTNFASVDFDKAIRPEFAGCYRMLKLHMRDTEAIQERQMFSRLEMKCERLQTKEISKKISYWFYAAFSDYGFSLVLPILWLFGFAASFALVFYTIQISGTANASLWALHMDELKDSAKLAIANIVPLLPARLLFDIEASDTLAALSVIQQLLSTMCIFLFGLALRNQFKINS